MKTTPSSLPNLRRYSFITSSLRCPLRNCTRGISCCAAKFSSFATKARLRLHQRRRRQRLAAMLAEEPHDPGLVLQPRHENVEIHAIDPLDRKLHMMAQDIRHALRYHRPGSGRAVLPLAGV